MRPQVKMSSVMESEIELHLVGYPQAPLLRKKGYIEDRRPASDIDPYVVAAVICDTALLEES